MISVQPGLGFPAASRAEVFPHVEYPEVSQLIHKDHVPALEKVITASAGHSCEFLVGKKTEIWRATAFNHALHQHYQLSSHGRWAVE